MFGLPVKPPGALYWFNVSLLFMAISSFYSMSYGAFPGLFVVTTLGIMSVLGIKKPLLNAQHAISCPYGFMIYSACMLSMCNLLDHVFHKPVTFPGVISVILSGVVGFFLGRYVRIGRFGLEAPPTSNGDCVSTKSLKHD